MKITAGKIFAILLSGFILLLIIAVLGLKRWNDRQSISWRTSAQEDQFIETSDGDVYFRHYGNEDSRYVVIIIPGFCSVSAEWWSFQETLADAGIASVSFDKPGYGLSDTPRDERNMAAEVSDVIDQMARRYHKSSLILLGDGVGASYALQYAVERKRPIAGLVITEPLTPCYNLFKERLDHVYYNNLFDYIPRYKTLRGIAGTGLMRLFRIVPYRNLEGHAQTHVMEQYANSKNYTLCLDEVRAMMRGACDEWKVSSPVVLVHHNREKYRKKMQNYSLAYDQVNEIESIWEEMYAAIESPEKVTLEAEAESAFHIQNPAVLLRAVRHLMP